MPSITTIPDTQCIGDSLGTINNNFSNLNVGINNNTTSITSLSSQYSNTSPGVAKAWVNFNGTGSGTITPNSTYNVSSVTRNANGNYNIYFTTPFATTSYCALVSMSFSDTTNVADGIPTIVGQFTNYVRVSCPVATTGQNPSTTQPAIVNVVVLSL